MIQLENEKRHLTEEYIHMANTHMKICSKAGLGRFFQGKGYFFKCCDPLGIYFIIKVVAPKLLGGHDHCLAQPCMREMQIKSLEKCKLRLQ